MTDKIDRIIAQWQSERPDLDSYPMALLGRLKLACALLGPQLERAFAEYGLNLGEFDVLATLRRSGKPYTLSPTELYNTLMLTSGAMTHRLKILENRGLIARLPNEQDSRSLLVQLTDTGFDLIDQAVTAHVANETALLSGLSDDEKQALNIGLSALLNAWDKKA